MERSLAIKCPSMGCHLAGTKKVQQVLAEPGMLERFISDLEEINLIRDTFTGHYSLDEVSLVKCVMYVLTVMVSK